MRIEINFIKSCLDFSVHYTFVNIITKSTNQNGVISITGGGSRNIALNKTISISQYGVPTVEQNSSNNNITIKNDSTKQYVTGLGIKSTNENYQGISAFNIYIYRNNSISVKPYIPLN